MKEIDIDYLYDVLKRTLEGTEEFSVEFDNEQDKTDFVLDICNRFRQILIEDSE